MDDRLILLINPAMSWNINATIKNDEVLKMSEKPKLLKSNIQKPTLQTREWPCIWLNYTHTKYTERWGGEKGDKQFKRKRQKVEAKIKIKRGQENSQMPWMHDDEQPFHIYSNLIEILMGEVRRKTGKRYIYQGSGLSAVTSSK